MVMAVWSIAYEGEGCKKQKIKQAIVETEASVKV